MVNFLKGDVVLKLQRVHSIDTASKTLKMTDVVEKEVTDVNFGGMGEKTTIVPQIQNVTIVGENPSVLSDIAQRTLNGEESTFLGDTTLTKVSTNQVVGVR